MADQTFAVHCGFFDAINSDRTYSADEMNRPYKRVISNGVFATPNGTPSTDLQVVASSGMNIICKKGEGLFGDKWFENPSGIAITVPSNTGTVPRIDSVLVQVDTRTSGRVGSVVHRTGTPSSSPVPPAINQAEGVIEYRLANIRVNAGVSAITGSMITDRRGSSDCPWVTSLIYQVDTSTLYDQWAAAYAEYFEEEKAIWDAWYAQLTEDLDVSMTLDRHVNTVTTDAQTTGYIPIGLAYNHNTDILEVYINGLRAIEGTHYVVVDDTTILVENQLQIGQEVTFVVMRSVISGSATNIMVLLQELESQIAGVAGGTPTVVDAKADMTEHDKIYILSTDGKWYYYSATQEDWVIGGTYGGVPTDTTLSISGSAADAKAVGDALAEKADTADVTALDTRVTAVEGDIDEINERLDELENSGLAQLYEPINYTTGKCILNGNIASSDLYSLSEYFFVTKGCRIHCQCGLNTDTLGLSVFNVDKEIIRTYTRLDGTAVGSGTLYSFDITIEDDDARYFAFTTRNTHLSSCEFGYYRAIPYMGTEISNAMDAIGANAKAIDILNSRSESTGGGNSLSAYIVETKARMFWAYYQEPPIFKNSDPRYVEDGNANNAFFKITGTAGDSFVTVVSGGNATPSDISDYTRRWSGVISADMETYKPCLAWYIDANTLGVWPALESDITEGELGALWSDNMHLTRRGYICFAQGVFAANPKYCEKTEYIAKWVAGETVPFTTIGGTMYVSTGSSFNYSEDGGYLVANQFVTYRKNNTGSSAQTGKKGVSWEVTSESPETGYAEVMVGGNYLKDPDIPEGYEIHIDIYVNDVLVHEHVKDTNVFECLYFDFVNAAKLKIEVYQNAQAANNTNGTGFRLSSIYFWKNLRSNADTLFPPCAVVGQMFDSWGVFHGGASGTEFSRLISKKAGMTVPFTNHSLGGQTSAWGKAWFYENLQQYHPSIGIVDFGINDSHSVSSSDIPATVAGPDGTLYNNKLTTAQYAENMRAIANAAKYNGIQLIITTNPLFSAGDWYYPLLDAGL